MSLDRMVRAAVVTLLVASGCTEEPTTGVPATEAVAPTDLDVRVPALTSDALIDAEIVQLEPDVPAGAFGDDPFEPDQPDSPDYTLRGAILGASTRVGFGPGYAYSSGRHRFTGNVGRVATEARVTFEGQVIGRRTAERQEAVPYLFDFGRIKQIWAEAYVFIDQDCGLTVDGDSDHEAWWQWFLGAGAPQWGDAGMSTQAFPPVSQPPCEETIEENPFTGGGDSGGEGDVLVSCWWWVTYDPNTGEIIDADLLYCEDVIGG